MIKNRIVTSEYVSPGHPDKIADQIADNILDKYLLEDKDTRAGIEVMVKDNIVVLGGEIHSAAKHVNHEECVKEIFDELDFSDEHKLDRESIKVINLIGQQSTQIHSGVDRDEEYVGAGDQGFMVGYANNETESYMPYGHWLAKKIVMEISSLPGLGPDAKSQVVVDYDNEGNSKILSILVSVQRKPEITLDIDTFRQKVKEYILKNILTETKDVNISLDVIDVNPCGDWTIGGPVADCGVTGRKIVVDQFGGYCNVGGGAHSGKDFSKVDRSAAYLCRYYAKHIVASGIANEAKVELGYKIGVMEPCAFNIEVDTDIDVNQVRQCLKANFEPTPKEIIKRFDLDVFKLKDIAKYGAYGSNEWLPWEVLDLSLIASLKNLEN